MNEEFDIKLESVILYITHLVLHLDPPNIDDGLQFIKYDKMQHHLTHQLLDKNMKLFYKLYKECQCNVNDKVKKVFTDEYNIHQYSYYIVASHLIDYMTIYQNCILDVFYKIITDV